ncbi:protein of unknown function DUF1221 [Dillenia turbinata]|uniref:Protein kinase domain-containing protein n=1 Tax=Dillenia turbinata TaxID=194707 RepID=A0AAN8US89_9MAGN
MEQFRQLGEVLGSMKTLLVFRDEIQVNPRQCSLLFDILSFAHDTIAEEIRQNLRFKEKNSKWKDLEHPLKELLRIYKEGESYIRQSLEIKDWWLKALTLYQNSDCVEFHIHNLLCCIPIVIEAIESAGEIAGLDHVGMQMRRLVFSKKYQKECSHLKHFQWRYGKQYLITSEFCDRLDEVWREDRWRLLNKVREKKDLYSTNLTKQEKRLTDLLLRNLDDSEHSIRKLLNASILLETKDYQVRRRLGGDSQYKEIIWLGEHFVLRHFFGDIETLAPEIAQLLSLSHPNILELLCGFTDDEKKQCFLVMELMSRDLSSYIKEICGPRRRIPFTLPVAVDLMLQIARGMEYLHSKQIYHGDLTPSNVLVRAKSISTDWYLHAKVSGFGLSSIKNSCQKTQPIIWCAPEVLAEQEGGTATSAKYSQKSDVYSFGMICFELLTGKVPFEDSHLQGDTMSRNIRAGERPLFPFYTPKYVTSLTKKCWHADPNQRPSFSSICRILRYIKRFLVMNPDHSQPEAPMPIVDYCDIEAGLLREISSWGASALFPVSQIPHQMFVYKVAEKEKILSNFKEKGSESESEAPKPGELLVIHRIQNYPKLQCTRYLFQHDYHVLYFKLSTVFHFTNIIFKSSQIEEA